MAKEKNIKVGRRPFSDEERQERQEFLKTETISARTKRVINPILKKTLKQLQRLVACANSPRYYFDDEQKTKILNAIQEQYNCLDVAFKGNSGKEEIEDIL